MEECKIAISGDIKELTITLKVRVAEEKEELVCSPFLSADMFNNSGKLYGIMGDKPLMGIDVFNRDTETRGFFILDLQDLLVKSANAFEVEAKKLAQGETNANDINRIVSEHIANFTKNNSESSNEYRSDIFKRLLNIAIERGDKNVQAILEGVIDNRSATKNLNDLLDIRKAFLASQNINGGIIELIESRKKEMGITSDMSTEQAVEKIKAHFEKKRADNERKSASATLKQFYDVVCPYCQSETSIMPSRSHLLGDYESGFTNCNSCKNNFDVHCLPASDTMLGVCI